MTDTPDSSARLANEQRFDAIKKLLGCTTNAEMARLTGVTPNRLSEIRRNGLAETTEKILDAIINKIQ